MAAGLKQSEVIQKLAESHYSFPAMVDDLISELGVVFVDAANQLTGEMFNMIDSRRKRYWRLNPRDAVNKLRHDNAMIKRLDRILNHLKKRVERRIYALMETAYKEALRSIADAWNQTTPDGFEIKHKATKKDYARLKSEPVGGLLVTEWIESYVAEYRRNLLGRYRMYIARPTGDEDGKRLLTNRIANATAIVSKGIRQIASQSVNIANRLAYDDENEAFLDDGTWDLQ